MVAPASGEPLGTRSNFAIQRLDAACAYSAVSMESAAQTDTIVAISTALGTGAIGIVRASGPRAVEYARLLFRPANLRTSVCGESHRMIYGHVVDPDSGRVVDEALMVIMLPPSTYTREDIVEVHCHGGPAAQRAVLRAFVRLGARPAEPGEFTRRAFLNGRIDLAQAESVAAIVQARSTSALRAAVRQLAGGLSDRLRDLRHALVEALALLEAGIDFSDEDVDALEREPLASRLGSTLRELEDLLETAFLGRVLEQGIRTAIVGKPNVGKSSLLNALLMRERAIVSELPGTTRDTVEELMEVGGLPLHLVDTAGLRNGADHVEQLGIERSRKALGEADLVLAVFDGSQELDEGDFEVLAELDPTRTILVANKSDLEPARELSSFAEGVQTVRPVIGGWTTCRVSALNGTGLAELRSAVERIAAGDDGLRLDEPYLATERQRVLVEEAVRSIKAAMEALLGGVAEELVCEDVRDSASALGQITGEALGPDLLDEIFGRFCIGK